MQIRIFCEKKLLLGRNFVEKYFAQEGRTPLHYAAALLGTTGGDFFALFLLCFFSQQWQFPLLTLDPQIDFKKRCEQLVFTPHRSWSRWKCRRHCKYSDHRLYILYILGHRWLKGWKKNHTSRNISKFPLFYDFCLEPDWRLSDRVLLENKKKWGNFLVGVLALNQQQLNRNPTKTWKSTARYLIGPNKRPVNFSAKEVNCLMISKYLFTSSPFILAGQLYCL